MLFTFHLVVGGDRGGDPGSKVRIVQDGSGAWALLAGEDAVGVCERLIWSGHLMIIRRLRPDAGRSQGRIR